MTKKIIIVDDHVIVREGLEIMINMDQELEVVGTAGNGKEAYELVMEKQPNLVLMDVHMPLTNGIESTAMIKKKWPHITILMLTTFSGDEYLIQALANGADGYLLKDIGKEQLLYTLKNHTTDHMVIPKRPASHWATSLQKNPESIQKKETHQHASTPFEFQLTKREREIASMLSQGYNNKSISQAFFISLGTVKNHISSIYEKLGVKSRAEAIIILRKWLERDYEKR